MFSWDCIIIMQNMVCTASKVKKFFYHISFIPSQTSFTVKALSTLCTTKCLIDIVYPGVFQQTALILTGFSTQRTCIWWCVLSVILSHMLSNFYFITASLSAQ